MFLGRVLDLSEQAGVVQFAEQVAGVEVAFAEGLVGGLGKLPVVEAGAEAASAMLWFGLARGTE